MAPLLFSGGAVFKASTRHRADVTHIPQQLHIPQQYIIHITQLYKYCGNYLYLLVKYW